MGVVGSELAESKSRAGAFTAGLLDPELTLYLYRHQVTGSEQPGTLAHHAAQPDRDDWVQVRPLETAGGLSASDAILWGQVDRLAGSLDEALGRFQLTPEQLESPATNWVVQQIERLAGISWLPQLLLTVGFFALLAEFSAPGLGAPGFTAGVCFLFFFWIQFFHGNAGYLELSLFLGGLACLALEIFVVPGFGIFGVGGGVMVLGSLVLASQTFVWPTNSYHWSQIPTSLGSLTAAMAGVLVGGVVMRRLLPNTPLPQKDDSEC